MEGLRVSLSMWRLDFQQKTTLTKCGCLKPWFMMDIYFIPLPIILVSLYTSLVLHIWIYIHSILFKKRCENLIFYIFISNSFQICDLLQKGELKNTEDWRLLLVVSKSISQFDYSNCHSGFIILNFCPLTFKRKIWNFQFEDEEPIS